MPSARAVSYTHLDVYKRQGLDTRVVHTVNDEYSLLAIYCQRPSESIKYSTDVYKRQIYDSISYLLLNYIVYAAWPEAWPPRVHNRLT